MRSRLRGVPIYARISFNFTGSVHSNFTGNVERVTSGLGMVMGCDLAIGDRDDAREHREGRHCASAWRTHVVALVAPLRYPALPGR